MNNTTTELQWGDVIFKPGQRVRTTDASDYAGLDGVILEIHTGEDKETDNLTPDIHCCFDFPESEADLRKLEERFSSLYNMPKKLDDLALDEVIMSPDELISIPEEPSRLLHYIGTDEWARPVYQDQYGKLWKDVELGDFEIPHLHSAVGNEFDGEPDMPIRASCRRKESHDRAKRPAQNLRGAQGRSPAGQACFPGKVTKARRCSHERSPILSATLAAMRRVALCGYAKIPRGDELRGIFLKMRAVRPWGRECCAHSGADR